MSFKVSFNGGTGHDDLDKENGAGEYDVPGILEFATEGERGAFLKGCNMTSEVMDGWVDAWVDTSKID